jgi:phytol kinase
MLQNNLIATALTFLLSLLWLRLNDWLAHRGWISSDLSRKIIHIGTGPLFVLCWPLFTDAPLSPFLAALVPLTLTIQFFLVGSGVIRDEAAVKAMSRTGDRREILRGPLYYGIIFVLLTVLYWRDSPIGITALMVMCGGDGLADVVGRRIPSPRLPWNRSKSISGSAAMFLGSYGLAAFILGVSIALGFIAGPLNSYLLDLLWISAAVTLVESLPLRDIDNITITLTAAALGHLLF